MADKIVNEIMEERLKIGIDMVRKIVKTENIKLTDYELMDIATRVANALFIEKNKSYRYEKANQ